MRRLAAVDAQAYWMSVKIPNDQFLLYGFAGAPADLRAALRQVRARAGECDDLRIRVAERGFLTYPAWVRGGVGDSHFAVHQLDDPTWAGCLAAVAALAGRQLDLTEMCWRLHVFAGVEGVPGVAGPGTVAVLQAGHALADGVWASGLAAWLFGRCAPVTSVRSPPPLRCAALPARALRAARTHRRLVSDVESGLVPPQADSRPVLRTNSRPDGTCRIRTLVRHRSTLSGPTVTVAVLAAVSSALGAHLRDLGEDPATLGAEVPMAKVGPRRAQNHFGNVGVGLFPGLAVDERAERISAELARRRLRARHPGMRAAGDAFAAVPAPLLRWGVAQFDPTVRSDTATGNTVVSSVDRGAADLAFGGAPVVVTAGYPALSPMMGVTHGVHGIGDTVAVSVHASDPAIGGADGLDAYVARLDAALG